MSRRLSDLLDGFKNDADAKPGAETFDSMALGFLITSYYDPPGVYSVRVITEATRSPAADRNGVCFERENVPWAGVPAAMDDLRAAVDAELVALEALRVGKRRARKGGA